MRSNSPEKSRVVSVGDAFVVDLDNCLGEGFFGKIFLGRQKQGGERVAVKTGRPSDLMTEYNSLVRLAEVKAKRKELENQPRRFPKVYHLDVSFRHRGESALVIEYLNKDLGKLFEEHRRKFSPKTTLMIAIQLLECLEQIHSANLLHCDLKPENCLIGRRSLNQESRLFMVDFGLSKEYRWPRDVKTEKNQYGAGKKGKAPFGGGKGKEDYEESMYEHIEDDGRRHSVRGTIRFISINSHKRRERSRRDEIESLSYVLLYLLNGGWLPWRGLAKHHPKNESHKRSHNQAVLEVKEKTSIDTLCQGVPRCYRELLETSRRMAFKERPDYERLRRLFYEELERRGWAHDSMFDWIQK